MRYMVTAEFNDPGALLPPSQIGDMLSRVVLPSLEAIAKLERDGKIMAAGAYTGARAGVLIIDAASNDEVSQLLMGLPFWGLVKWKVTPLDTFAFRAEAERKIAEQLQQAK